MTDNPMNLDLSEYSFSLPEELIAVYPAEKRDHSRLFIADRKKESFDTHRFFYDLGKFLNKGDLLVFNRTKVSRRRVFLRTESARIHECMFLTEENSEWHCLIRNSAKLKENQILISLSGIKFHYTNRNGKSFLVPEGTVSEDFFEKDGTVPIPPYLKRKAEESDTERYQTIFAESAGSAAAPTAGLHFTEKLKTELEEQGIIFTDVCLHVGYGTFAPLTEEQIASGKLHSERFSVSEKTAELCNTARDQGNRVISVGTTSLRALESCFDSKKKKYMPADSETDIFLKPGDEIFSIDGLITNFHLPESSLLLLVSCFAGKDFVLSAYRRAVEEKFRFYSFGDAMLLI